jgi:uncharacterized protein (TIGR02271 family)
VSTSNRLKGETMDYERIVAVYDRTGKARDAARALEASGFPAGDISVIHRDSVNVTELREPKLWHKLFGREVNDSESTVFTRTIESGGGIVTLRAPDTEISRAMKILDVHNPVDMRNRTETPSRVDVAEQTASSSLPRTKTSPAPSAETTRVPLTTELAREEVLRLHEEQLDVGKRVVEIGKARVRRFVVEKPVESQIKLHEEHATISRRPVSDPGALKGDIDWSDKTFEITETAEQAVVTKKARVADEVVIRREGSDHVETVRDTVRRQEIELERPGSDRDIRDRDLRDRDLKKAA